MVQIHFAQFYTILTVGGTLLTLDSKAMDLFRALNKLHGGEIEASERSLILTKYLVQINPANYTIWQYRASVLIKITENSQDNTLLQEEISFLNDFARENMKNYQVWYVHICS